METKLNSGAIFKNEKKQKETHPDYNGTINVDGVDKQISLWVKESKNGLKYFSVSIQEPYKNAEGITNEHAIKVSKQEEDLPF